MKYIIFAEQKNIKGNIRLYPVLLDDFSDPNDIKREGLVPISAGLCSFGPGRVVVRPSGSKTLKLKPSKHDEQALEHMRHGQLYFTSYYVDPFKFHPVSLKLDAYDI